MWMLDRARGRAATTYVPARAGRRCLPQCLPQCLPTLGGRKGRRASPTSTASARCVAFRSSSSSSSRSRSSSTARTGCSASSSALFHSMADCDASCLLSESRKGASDLGNYDGAMICEPVNIVGHNEDLINAYMARPLGPGPYPTVVIIHHMPGWCDPTKEIARRFAHHGYVAVSPNLQFREGKDTAAQNSQSIRENGGMPDDRTMGDLAGAISFARALPYTSGKVGCIGYCSGGRQSWLAACKLPLDAAVCCYGGGVVAKPEQLSPAQPVQPLDFTSSMACPILGMFGETDGRPSPEDTATMEAACLEHGKHHEFFTYKETGHAFFAVDRTAYRPIAVADGWKRIFCFFGRTLLGQPPAHPIPDTDAEDSIWLKICSNMPDRRAQAGL